MEGGGEGGKDAEGRLGGRTGQGDRVLYLTIGNWPEARRRS